MFLEFKRKYLNYFLKPLLGLASSLVILSGCSLYVNVVDLSSSADLVNITSNFEPYTRTPVTLTLDFSSEQPDFSLSQLEVTNGTVSNLSGGPKVYQLTLTPQLDGVVEVKVAGKMVTSSAITASGEEFSEAYQLTYDTVAPVVSNIQRVAPLSSPSTATTVQVQIDVSEISYIKIYSESSCTTEIGSATSSAGVANVLNTVSVSGVYNYHAIATDLAGNSSACTVPYASYELDLTPPSMASLTVAIHDPASSPGTDKTPTIRIAGYDDAESVYVYTNSSCTAPSLYGSGYTSGGFIDITSATDLSDGVYNFYVRLQDALGNATGCSTVSANYILDTGAPSLASSILLVNPLTSPSSDSTPTVDVLGVESGAVVKIFNDNTCSTEIASGTASAASIELTTNVLAEGSHNFYVEVIDIVGNSSGCSSSLLTYVLDTTAPTTPTLALFNPASSPSNDTTPTLRASGVVSGDTVKLYSDNTCTTEVATGTASGTTIDLTPSTAVEGVNNYYTRAIDPLGNLSGCSAGVSYTLDTTTPSAPSALALQSPLVSPSNDTTPTIRISGVVSGDTVRLYKDSSCTAPNLMATGVAAGTTIDLTSSVLTEGSYVYYANSTDPAGNTSTCSTASVAYVLDSTAPANPTGLTLQDPTSSPGNDSTPTIRVSGVAVGDNVAIYSSNLCTTALASGVVGGGTTIDLVVAPSLADGTYNFYVKVDDVSSNTTGCLDGSLTYVLDTVAPAIPNSLTLQSPATSPNTDKTPTIRVGGVVSGDVITLYRDNVCTLTVASATAAGVNLDLTPASDLADGTYNFYAKAEDAAGNESACSAATVSYVLDTVAPSNAVTLALENPASSPANDTTPTIKISSVVSGDVVRMYSDNTCATQVATGTAAATDINLTTSVLTAGTYQFYAQMTDTAGNVSACSTNTVTYVLDLTAPATPTPLSLVTPASSPGNVKRPVIRAGGVTSGDTISIYNNSACAVGNLVVSGVASGASLDLTAPSDLADGAYSFYVRATDPATNESACSAVALVYVLDSGVPAAPTSLTLKNPVTSVGQNRTPEITIGGVEVNAVVSLHTNSSCTAKVGEGTAGATTIDLVVDNNLADGTYVFYARQIDPAGNSSACSTANVSYTVDNTAPSAPSALAMFDPATSTGVDSTPTIQVSGVVAGDTVYLYTDNTCSSQVGTQAIVGTTVNVTSSVLAEGTYDFYAKAVDPAGNDSACSTNKVTYTYAQTRPTVTLAANISGHVFDRVALFTVTVSESVTGFALADISVTGGVAQNLLGSGSSYTFEVKNNVEGTISVSIPQDSFINGATTGNSASNTISYTYEQIKWKQEAFIKAANAETDDYFAYSVGLHGDTLVVGAAGEDSITKTITNGSGASTDNDLQNSGAVFVYKRAGTAWSQQSYIKANNSGPEDYFGDSVSVYGDTLVVGAPTESSDFTTITNGSIAPGNSERIYSGAVYVYRRIGNSWDLESFIKASNADAGDNFGEEVIIHGNRIAVHAKQEDSNQSTITNGSMASSDNSYSNVGAIYIYSRQGVNWMQEAYIKASNVSNSIFASNLAMDKDTLIVGSEDEHSAQVTITNGAGSAVNTGSIKSGAVFVYRRTNNIWAQEAYIKAPNAETLDGFGHNVGLDNGLLAVGALGEDSNETVITNSAYGSSNNGASGSGAVYVFKRTGVNWAQEAYIKPGNNAANMKFGCAVKVSNNRIVVGAPGERSNQTTITNGEGTSANISMTDNGAVYIYTKYGNSWIQEAYIKPVNGVNNLTFGENIKIEGNTLVVGANNEASNSQGIINGITAGSGSGAAESGAVYVYSMNTPLANLNGVFDGSASSATNLNITVGGSDITRYRYKVGPAGSTDCSDISGYSALTNISTPISSLLSGYPDGEMILCVLGENSSGAVQSVTSATKYRWVKDTTAPTAPSGITDGVTEWLTGAYTPNFSYTGSTDASSGVQNYEASLGSSAGDTSYASWKSIPIGDSSIYFEDLPIPYGANVYLNMRAKDAAGNISSVSSSDGYTVTCNSSVAWCPQAYIKAVNADAGDMFGGAISLSNDTLAVGAEGEQSSTTTIVNGSTTNADNSGGANNGAVYVYRRSGVNWSQEAYIKASNAQSDAYFGASVSLSGDTLLVGAYCEDSIQSTITNGAGSATDFDAPNSGAAYVYRRSGVNWAQEAYIKASNNSVGANDTFGYRLSLDRDTIAVAAEYEDSGQTIVTNGTGSSTDESLTNSGAVYIYRRTGNLWAQEAYIKAANVGANDNFSSSVRINGDTVVIGARLEDSNSNVITNGTGTVADDDKSNSGAVYIYRRTGTTWQQEAFIKASNNEYGDYFGGHVSISGDTLAVGALREGSGATTITNGATAPPSNGRYRSGAVFVYTRDSNSQWSQQAHIKASNADQDDLFGVVSLSGNLLIVGSDEDSHEVTISNGTRGSKDNSKNNSGAVYVYRRTGVNWAQEAYIKTSNASDGDYVGSFISVNANAIAVGSRREDSSSTSIINGLGFSSDDSTTDSGAAYVYQYQPAFVQAKRFTGADIYYHHVDAANNVQIYVEYSDNNSSWTTVKVQNLVRNQQHIYTLAWNDMGPHRYWRLRFIDPDDGIIGRADELVDVAFYQLNHVKVLPSTATRLSSNFTSSANAEDGNSATSAVWDGSNSGVISWDFGP